MNDLKASTKEQIKKSKAKKKEKKIDLEEMGKNFRKEYVDARKYLELAQSV